MNFQKAIEAMSNGKKVRREGWKSQLTIRFNNGYVLNSLNETTYFTADDLEGSDWEIFSYFVDFTTALNHVINGGMAKRESWDKGYLKLNNNNIVYFTIKHDNHFYYTWEATLFPIAANDVLATDWILL